MNTIGIACHSDGIVGFGNPDSDVMILGIAPGRNEMSAGKPFVGESGRLLDSILRAVEWSRDDVYVTNLICTWNDAPTSEQLTACRPRLLKEIEQFKPRLIITMGKIATEQVFPQWKFGNVQGAVMWTENVLGSGHSCYVLPTFHPAAILYGVSAFIHPIYRDLAKIKTVLPWEPYAPLAYVHNNRDTWFVAESEAQAQDYINHLDWHDYIAIDIESAQGKDTDEMLDVFSDKLLCVGLSDGKTACVIPEPLTHNLTWREHELQYTGHNFNFDKQGMKRFIGVDLPIKHDTMLMSYALDERAGVHGLKFLVRENLGANGIFYEAEAHAQAKARKGFQYVDKDVLYEYNARDAIYTARLAPILYDKMIADKVIAPYRNLLIPAANVFAEIQQRGIKVDLDVLNALTLKWFPAWQQAEDGLKAYAVSLGAKAPFNVRSGPQLKKLLFDTLGLTPMPGKVTKVKHEPQLDKEVLESLSGEHPFIDKLAEFKGLEHAVNDLLTVRDNIKLDGNLHSTTKLHGTVTGRTSMVDPALQQIRNPKYESNQKFAEMRDFFVPNDSSTHVIAEADYSRAELYCAVVYSHDEQMAADLATGDPHSLTASQIFRKSLEEVTREDRTKAKHIVFGHLYGRGANAMAKGELHCKPYEAEVFINRLKARYATYTRWAAATRNLARTQGELVSITGRKRRFKLILPDDFKSLNEGVNAPIQSLASDITLMAAVRLHALLAKYDSFVLLIIHDSIVLELSKAHLETVLPIIKHTMESQQFEGAPIIPIEIAIGPSWGETKEVTIA